VGSQKNKNVGFVRNRNDTHASLHLYFLNIGPTNLIVNLKMRCYHFSIRRKLKERSQKRVNMRQHVPEETLFF
jgi:hypothetical protein